MKLFVRKYARNYFFYLLVFQAAQHFVIESYSMLLTHYVVLYHVHQIARIRNVLRGIEIERRRRILAVYRLRTQRYYGFTEQFQMKHLRNGYTFQLGGVLFITLFIEIEIMVKIL